MGGLSFTPCPEHSATSSLYMGRVHCNRTPQPARVDISSPFIP